MDKPPQSLISKRSVPDHVEEGNRWGTGLCPDLPGKRANNTEVVMDLVKLFVASGKATLNAAEKTSLFIENIAKKNLPGLRACICVSGH